MNTNQKSMRYDQNDYDALLHSKIPAALVETPQMNFDDAKIGRASCRERV